MSVIDAESRFRKKPSPDEGMIWFDAPQAETSPFQQALDRARADMAECERHLAETRAYVALHQQQAAAQLQARIAHRQKTRWVWWLFGIWLMVHLFW